MVVPEVLHSDGCPCVIMVNKVCEQFETNCWGRTSFGNCLQVTSIIVDLCVCAGEGLRLMFELIKGMNGVGLKGFFRVGRG